MLSAIACLISSVSVLENFGLSQSQSIGFRQVMKRNGQYSMAYLIQQLTNQIASTGYSRRQAVRGSRFQAFDSSAVDYGMARRNVEDWIHPTPFGRRTESRPVVAYYPVTSSISQRNWPIDPTRWNQFVTDLNDPTARIIETAGGQNRGFGACWSLIYDHFNENTMKSLAQVVGHTAIDGSRVYSLTGEPVTGVGGPDFFLEKDEYVFLIKSFDFGVMGGDVR